MKLQKSLLNNWKTGQNSVIDQNYSQFEKKNTNNIVVIKIYLDTLSNIRSKKYYVFLKLFGISNKRE